MFIRSPFSIRFESTKYNIAIYIALFHWGATFAGLSAHVCACARACELESYGRWIIEWIEKCMFLLLLLFLVAKQLEMINRKHELITEGWREEMSANIVQNWMAMNGELRNGIIEVKQMDQCYFIYEISWTAMQFDSLQWSNGISDQIKRMLYFFPMAILLMRKCS